MDSATSKYNERTRACLQEIEQSTTQVAAHIVTGLPGAGRTSLAKLMANETGLVDDEGGSSTDACQVFDATVNGAKHFIIDTPGFEPRSEWETFRQIVSIIDRIRNKVTFAGVWFVVDNRAQLREAERMIYRWLSGFCGEAYYPQLTFVTTFWGGNEPQELRAHNMRFNHRVSSEWARFVGAHTHQLGRKYVNGKPTDDILSWYNDRDELAVQAREMVARHYADSPSVEPRIVHELRQGIALTQTEAAQVLCPGNAGTADQRQASAEVPESSQRNFDSTKSQRTPNGQASQEYKAEAIGPSALELISRGILWTLDRVLEGGVIINYSNAGGGTPIHHNGSGVQSPRMSRGDPFSIVDGLKVRELPSDFKSREQRYHATGGLGKYVGSVSQNWHLMNTL